MTLPRQTIRLLIVEDSEEDRESYRRLLSKESSVTFEFSEAETGAEAVDLCAAEQPDCVLLDFRLPDMDGLAVLGTIQAASKQPIPVLLLTGAGHESLGIEALRLGAQDYLVKGEGLSGLLTKSVLFAIERNQWARERQRRVERQEDEMLSLDRLSTSPESVAARLYGSLPIRESAEKEYEALVVQYGDLLDDALEQRVFEVQRDVSKRLHDMCEMLGFLGAGPQDVVDVYVTALRRLRRGTPEKAEAYADEGRLIALELMGHLVSYYRNRAGGGLVTPEAAPTRGGSGSHA